jgi:hypothetical protein
MTFIFKASPVFVMPDCEHQRGEYPADWHVKISKLRALHPELASWGDLAIGSAWGSYSQDILAVGWVDWIDERDDGFLAYIYIRIKNPHFEFGGTGLFDSKVYDFGDTHPWSNDAPLPAWAIANE